MPITIRDNVYLQTIAQQITTLIFLPKVVNLLAPMPRILETLTQLPVLRYAQKYHNNIPKPENVLILVQGPNSQIFKIKENVM